MKKLKLISGLLLLTIASLFIFNRCEVEETPIETTPDGPVIQLYKGNFISKDTTITLGYIMRFAWKAQKGDTGLTSFDITLNGESLNGYPDVVIPEDDYTDTLFLQAPMLPGEYEYKFKVTDELSMYDEKKITIKITASLDKAPSLTLASGDYISKDTILTPGYVLKFAIKGKKGKNDLAAFSILKNDVLLTGYPNTSIPKEEYIDTVIVMAPLNEGKYSYELRLEDSEGMMNSKLINITISSSLPGTNFTLTKTGEISHMKDSTKASWSLTADKVIALNDTASIQNSDASAGTFTGSFVSEDGSMFVKANVTFDYIKATVETAASTYAKGTPSNTVANPVADDIYIVLKGTEFMVLKITAIDATTGKMTFEYKKN